jgi:dTMP kinase
MVLKNFIAFEGIDGSGTSTQIKKLVESNPNVFIATAEPTTNETGKFLRRMLCGEVSVDEKTASYLFAADRCEHIFGKDGIEDLIKNGKTVVSDRYFFSSLAYQSVSCGKDLPRLLNSPFPLPEYLFYFKIDPEISLKRVDSRNGQKEIYEKLDIQKKIAKLYDEVIEEYQEKTNESGMKIIIIDATKSIDEVFNDILGELKQK